MKARLLLLIFTAVLLSACAATPPNPSATPKAMNTAAPEASSIPTVAVAATVQLPIDTPEPIETVEIDLTEEANNVLATKIAKFSVDCKDFYIGNHDLSPDENWLAISCGYVIDQTLEIVNRDGKRWTLQYKDYLPKEFGPGGDGNLKAVSWSNDSQYLYFISYIANDSGGVCFYGYGVHGLFRVEVNTGIVSTVLPPTFMHDYYIVFSPTGRRIAYGGAGNPIILDLQTGDEISINVGNDTTGSLIWSPDGTELAYGTCQYNAETETVVKSAIKIFSIQKNISRTVLEIDGEMIFVESWNVDNIIGISKYYYGEESQPFDLNTGQWLTPTPTPQN